MRKHMLVVLALAAAPAAPVAASPLQIEFGRDVDRLQQFVDRRYGSGRIDVRKDYIGARTGEIDPWFWVGDRIGVVRIKLLRRDPAMHVLGWYLENGSGPEMPEDGGVLSFSRGRSYQTAVVALPGMRNRFGFYIDSSVAPGGDHRGASRGDGDEDDDNADSPRESPRHFTNRRFNDCGPGGAGAVHPPFDGDVQALIFDVSRWAGPDTWLVCFEDRDSGGMPDRGIHGLGGREEDDRDDDDESRSCRASDNDFDDVIFEVGAEGATAARALTFGALKARYIK